MSISLTISSLVCGWREKKKEIPILNSGEINFDLTKNLSILPIFGRTGFGKTTLLHVLSGIMPPLSGSVSWKLPKKKQISWSSQKQPLNLLRSGNFGIMMQGAELPRFMTIGEAIKLKIHYQSNNNNIKKNKIEESISRFCLSNEDPKKMYNSFPSNLSGGQRQRMALAYALSNDPIILFADEPTGALDKETRKEVLLALEDWLQEDERAIVFVSHHEDDPEFFNKNKKTISLKKCWVLKDENSIQNKIQQPSYVKFD